MATQNKVSIGLELTDNGSVKKTIKSVEDLHSTIQKTQKTAASGISVGGTAGSRRVAAAGFMPSGAAAAAEKAEITEYGRMRGSAGATGASARDFANQAQGLGGLVRLYATYAANIFAVSAAFNALSRAMDTTNMVRGLDQLGAASGTALGSLSKRFVEATEGAVSLREAMEAVTKASSSGMSDRDILRIAAGAKQASQALGVDMSDAVSRLTRGITKLEPELLDELGIFVRVDDAVKSYAQSVGKSASALTDFERRMAFSSAALTQVEQKFGQIKLDTNPYTQLLATVKDVSQSILELVNTGLAPLVKILSSSPTALATVLGGLGITLVKQAIPALSDYRKSLEKMSEAAKETAKSRLQDLKSSLGEELALKVKALDDIAEAEATAFEKTSDKLAMASKKVKGYDKKAFEISQKAIPDITKEEIEYLEQLGTKGKKISSTYSDMAANLRTYTDAAEMYSKAKQEQNILLTKGSSLWTTVGQNELEYHNQVNEARRRGMVSSTAYTASTKGFIAGLKESFSNFKAAGTDTTTTIDILNKAGEKTGSTFSVVTGKMNLFSRGILLVKLSAVSAVAAIGTAINAFMVWIQVIGLAVAAFGVLNSWLTKNSEESKKFEGSINSASSSIKTLDETLNFINKKPFGEKFSTQSLEARAKAFSEVGMSIKSLVSDLEAVEKAASTWDKFINNISKIWGGDTRSQFTKSITSTVIGALDASAGTAEASKARDKIAKLLRIDPKFTKDEFNRAIALVSDNIPLLDQVSSAVESIGTEASIAASKARELDDAFKASSDALKAVTDQFKVKDPLALLGENIVGTSQKLAQALTEPTVALQKLTEISSDPDKLKMFTTEDQLKLVNYSAELKAINKNLDEQTRAVEKLKKERADLQKSVEERAQGRDYDSSTGQYYTDEELAKMDKIFAQRLAAAKEKEKELLAAEQKLVKARKDSEIIVSKFPELAANQFQKGADLISVGITASMAKASSMFKETVLGSLGNIPGVAKAREQIELGKLAADRSLIQVTQELVRATMENTVATQLATAKQEYEARALEAREAKFTGGTAERMREAQQRVSELARKQEIVQMDPKQVLSSMGKITQEIKAGNKEISSDAAGLLNYLNSLAGAGIQLAANAQQAQAVRYKAIIDSLKEEFEANRRNISNLKERNSYEQQRINNLILARGYSNEELTLASDLASKEALSLTTQEKLLAIQERRAILEKAQASGVSTLTPEQYDQEQDRLNAEAVAIALNNQASVQAINLSTTKKIVDIRTQELNRVSQIEKKQRELAGILKDTQVSSSAIALDTAKQTEAYTGEYIQALETEKSMQDAKIAAQRAVAEESAAFALAQKTAQQELWALEQNGAFEAAERMQADMDLAKRIHEARLRQIEEEKRLRLMSIDEIAKYREQREDFGFMLEGVRNLDAVWQGVGTTIAKVIETQDAFSTKQNQYAKTLQDLDKKLGDAKGPEERKKVLEQIEKVQQKQQKDEITGYAKSAGAAKAMFKEKTAAHKGLAALEKVLHITRLAMDIKEMVSDTTKTGVSVANSATRTGASIIEAGIDGVKAVVKAIASLPFPLNIAAGAATAAVVAGLLGQIGGKKPDVSGGSGLTSEQLQETQGTGTAWSKNAQGELVKVDVAGGVFGDNEAKVDSIRKSLEIIRDNTIDGLDYDDKLLRAMQRVADSVTGAATSLYTIPGFRKGTNFGTLPGSATDTNWYQDIPIIGGILGGIFGGGTTVKTSIESAGIQLKGSFDQVISDTSNSILQYKDILKQFHEDGGWFGSDDEWTERNRETQQVSQAVQSAFSDIFKNAKESFTIIAEQSGITASRVSDLFKNMSATMDIDLMGLTGEEVVSELNAAIGSKLNEAAEILFGSVFGQYKKFGEGFLETAVRVSDGNQKVRKALEFMGSTFNLVAASSKEVTGVIKVFGITLGRVTRLTYENSFAISEALIKNAGSLEKFVDQAKFFSDNFLTESEKFSILERNLNSQLQELGVSTNISKKQFKDLVQNLDLSTESGRSLYQGLMELAPAFVQVRDFTESLLQTTIDKFKEFANSLREFRDNLILGSQSILTPLQKYAESKLQFEETYTKALAGDEAAQGKLTGAAQTFLTASKDYFASSAQYTQDFNSVLDKIGVGITESESQISIAERQLNGITEQIGLLTQINENIAYIAGVPQAATGGRVSGLTFVGEKGPELVNFTSAATVYSADQTRGMFASPVGGQAQVGQVVAELVQLRKEVTQLRKEQQQQTGDLITSNYDANSRAAQAIASEISDTSTTKEWAQRNQVVVV